MQGPGLHNYQFYQHLLSGEPPLGAASQEEGAAAAAVAFFQPPAPTQAPTLDQWVVDPAGYVGGDGFLVPPQPLHIPGGTAWDGNGDGFVHHGGEDWAGSGGAAQGEAWAAESMMTLGGDVFTENDLLMLGGGVPDMSGSVQDLLMDGVDLSKLGDAFVNSLWASSAFMNQASAADPTSYVPPMVPTAEPNKPASDSPGPSTQFGAASSPSQMPASLPAMDYPQAAASVSIPQAVPGNDEEEVEVVQMVRAAARYDEKLSTVWSEEENQALRDGLTRFAGQDSVTKCFSIASGLANKTVLDVAYRIRWLSDLEKKRASKQAQLGQEKSAAAKVAKGKGTKGATRKNNKYPHSKEVLNSKSGKELIRDNARLMDKIEETLRTGQVKDSPDYFYYVKMNMDALQNKVKDMATVMEGLSVDDEEWADVLKDRSSSA